MELMLEAIVSPPMLIEPSPEAVLKVPIAKELSPDAVDAFPIAVEFSPEAVADRPIAVEDSPDASVNRPSAVEDSPDACVLYPMAMEYVPTLAWSQVVLLTLPTLKAALSGYHIILVPVPLTGGFPGTAGRGKSPVKTVLLSFTCNCAKGVEVLIPTLPLSLTNNVLAPFF